jgi:hypothetical protein
MVTLMLGRLALMAALIVLPGFIPGSCNYQQACLLTTLFVVNGVCNLRSFLTATAAEQLNSILLFYLAACAWWPDGRFHTVTLCAIAVQTLFCYLSNGVIKMLEPDWRSGANLKTLFQLAGYSRPVVSRWAARVDAAVFRWLSMGVICWELSAMVAPLVPGVWLDAFLAIGICFHLTVAFVIGLNTFFWTFLSTYPAIIFLHGRLDVWLG